MNRRERRLAVARGKIVGSPGQASIDGLMADAQRAYQQGQVQHAEAICKQILAADPGHVASLNLVGLIYQAAGRHKLAIKAFAKALAADDLAAACHYNIATSYQAVADAVAAAKYFRKAIALGMGDNHVEEFVLRNPAVIECVKRMMARSAFPVDNESLFDAGDVAAIAKDIFFRCALETTILRALTLELLLIKLRSVLLGLASSDALDAAKVDHDATGFFCALAQQCFNNEYVFALGDAEARQANELRDVLLQKLSAGEKISPLLLAAVAAYFPLHSLPSAQSLLAAQWPDYAADLLRQQVREPMEEAEDRRAIKALTPIDDGVSLQAMQQYEENPYPRWTVNPYTVLVGDMKRHAAAGGSGRKHEILIAGCGTGQHSIAIAQTSPESRVLAIDISRASLAYARRKTREEGLHNIEYAQADIVKMGNLGRTFDHIEAGGVLHHLADPMGGWRVLLSLLRPNGIMRIGLYSEIARQAFAEARALIAERGYRATDEDIRAFRHTIIRARDEKRWNVLINTLDFYTMSGCRDLLFNVMEHRFKIPEIATFLNEQRLSFLGFELNPQIVEKFRRQYPGPAALTNLDDWCAFEAANPETFLHMYIFSVRKTDGASS
jgi:SAM-dependent methyltransferase